VVEVQNLGAQTQRDVKLAFTLPAGVQFATDGMQLPPGWSCDLQASLTCTRPPLAGSDRSDLFDLPVAIAAGRVGDVLTLGVTANCY
jgi:hypothetical protein